MPKFVFLKFTFYLKKLQGWKNCKVCSYTNLIFIYYSHNNEQCVFSIWNALCPKAHLNIELMFFSTFKNSSHAIFKGSSENTWKYSISEQQKQQQQQKLSHAHWEHYTIRLRPYVYLKH